EKLGEAWFRLGEAHHVLHNDTAAKLSLHKCIESEGPFAFRARYQLAVSDFERGNLADAEAKLSQSLNLLRGEKGEAHEHTLYLLAEVLFQTGNYRPAALRWEEALAFYPTSSNALKARFLLSECYQRLADVEAQSLRQNDPQNVREFHLK